MDQVKEYYQRWCDTPQPRKIRTLKLITFVFYSLFLLFLVIYAFGRTGKKTASIVPTVLFTDGTPYNLQVVRYLAQRRDVVIAMIVVNNNSLAVSKLKSTAGSVAAMLTNLQAEGYTKTVPVYQSQTSTTDSFAAPLNDMLATQSVKFVIAGACTEAAYFLNEYPARRDKVKNIYVGGGAFNKDGNANFFVSTNTKAERNFYMDPAAANYIVSGSHGRPVTLLPLDAGLTLTDSVYATIVAAPSSSAASVEAVAVGLAWYYTSVDSSRSTTLGILAAACASDTQVYQSAAGTVIPVQVITGATNTTNGRSYMPVSGTVAPNQSTSQPPPPRPDLRDCSSVALRTPAYVAAREEAAAQRTAMVEPLSFTAIQQRIRDHFVRDLDDETELASGRYVLTAANVERFLFPLFQRADEKAVRVLGEVWGRSRDPSRKLSDQLVAVLTRRQHVLLQGTELTLMELKEKLLLVARLQEPLTAGEVRQLAIQLGPTNRRWAEEWLRGRAADDVVEALALYRALRDMVQQQFGAFTFAGAYYPTVLDDLIALDERPQSRMIYPPRPGVPPPSVRARACEELFIFTIFCGVPLSLDTYFLAVALLDRFLATLSTPKEHLRLYSMAALLLASKCDHSLPTLDPRFVSIKMKLAEADVAAAEEEIVCTLNFDTTVATLHHFCEALVLHQDPPASPEQRRLLEYLIASLSIHTYYGQYRQSCLAAAALHSSRHAAQLATGEPSEQVRVLLPTVYAALQKNNVERSPGNMLKQVFAKPERHAVSLTPPAVMFPSLSCRSSLSASQ